MKYKNDKEYTFKHGECTAHVILNGFSDEVKEHFNESLAEEKIKSWKQRENVS